MTSTLASETPVAISQRDFDIMLNFAQTAFALKDNRAYLSVLSEKLSATAHIKTTWPSVLMGYDFHLTPDGPKLIEINNNAGGLYIGDGRWLPQPDISTLQGSLESRLVSMFHADWQVIAIMDEDVTDQFMYPEMQAYAELLKESGREVLLLNPEDLRLGAGGLCAGDLHIDAIYNRHTDFYLNNSELKHIRAAYEWGEVALNPHPRSYALIGDKSRMVDWWERGLLEVCLSPEAVNLIRAVTPETYLLADMDTEAAWAERKRYVFKPSARHGGKGVVIGSNMSRKRFDSFDPEETIMQQFVPPSSVEVGERSMKLDIRLYMHGANLIALAGRVWRGQLTNFREEGSGWVALTIGD